MGNSTNKYRPKLEIPRSEQERFFDAITIGGLILLIALPLINYGNLPDEIPIHFNGSGEVDDWSNKSFIWVLPGIGVAMAVLMFYLTTIPHHYNYTVEITEKNAPTQYQRGRTIIRFFNVFDTLLFALITWFIIRAAKGNAEEMKTWMLPIISLATLVAVGYAFRMAYKKD